MKILECGIKQYCMVTGGCYEVLRGICGENVGFIKAHPTIHVAMQ